MSTFTADLARFAEKTGRSIERTHREVCIELFSGILKDSPVDTGRFRGNWQASARFPRTGTLPIRPAAVAQTEILTNVGPLGGVTYFANNLPYAMRLEEGYSRQAPVGMVRTNVARFERMVAAAARRNRV
jgi:hypothetical protein